MPTFTVDLPTGAVLDDAIPVRAVNLTPGTRLRWLSAGRWTDYADGLCTTWNKFEPLDGECAGRVVTIEIGDRLDYRIAEPDCDLHWADRPYIGLLSTIRLDDPVQEGLPRLAVPDQH